MKNIFSYIIALAVVTISSCSTSKLVSKKNKFFELKEIQTEGGSTYSVLELQPTSSFKADVSEKTDYIVITPKSKNITYDTLATIIIDPEKVSSAYIDLIAKKYFPEIKNQQLNISRLNYYDIKFGLQALTIPLKFRKSVGNDTLNPPNVETGVNVGFAPGWKFTKNIYKTSKNYLGKNTTQVAIAIGPHFGVGTADLKKASTAPGLLSDRKRPTFTYGGYLLLGFNNINLGFAFGKDYVIGTGKTNWIYQGKTWTGIIVSLDILKY
jgi:hypothetical protein